MAFGSELESCSPESSNPDRDFAPTHQLCIKTHSDSKLKWLVITKPWAGFVLSRAELSTPAYILLCGTDCQPMRALKNESLAYSGSKYEESVKVLAPPQVQTDSMGAETL